MSDTKVTVIPQIRQIYYDAYASLPTTGLRAGDLGYATDRLVLYRWSGSAWQSITTHASSGTAAAIPTASDLPNGSLYYETDSGKTKQVQSGAWATVVDPTAYGATLVHKSSDETVNNSTTLQNDDALLFAVAANEIWEFELWAIGTWTTNGEIKWAFAVPTGGSIRIFTALDIATAADFYDATADGTTPQNDAGSVSDAVIRIKGLYIGGANAGNVQFQWAQNTSHADNTTIHQNSWLKANKVA